MMVGGMERLVELSAEHAKTRQQFGQPIGRFQAVKHRIVDMMVMVELSRSLTYDAALAISVGRDDAGVAAAAAKAYASRSFVSVAAANLQVHGGFGFTWESDAHLYLKRAKALEHYGGSVEEFRACCQRSRLVRRWSAPAPGRPGPDGREARLNVARGSRPA